MSSTSVPGETFPRKSLHTEISPLRYASVEMTKGRVVMARSRGQRTETAGPSTSLRSGRDDNSALPWISVEIRGAPTFVSGRAF